MPKNLPMSTYEWMAFKTRDSKTLETDIDVIYAEFGEHYQLTF